MSVPATVERTTPAAQLSEPASSGQPGAIAVRDERSGNDTVSSAADPESESRGRDYFREAFMAVRGQTVTAPQAPPASTRPAQEQNQPEGSPTVRVRSGAEDDGTSGTVLPQTRERRQPSSPATTDPDVITLTPQEYERRVQSEADKRIARQQREREAARAREEEVELRRTKPFEYAQMMEEREAQREEAETKLRELSGALDIQIATYDRHILDPLISALPEKTRREVIGAVKDPGIPGRAKVAAGALKALEAHWKDEGARTARERLLKDPTFVKEVLARHGGNRIEPDSTPSLPVSAGRGPVSENDMMNGFMRNSRQSVAVSN